MARASPKFNRLAVLGMLAAGWAVSASASTEYGSGVLLGRWGGLESGAVIDSVNRSEGQSGKWSKQNNDFTEFGLTTTRVRSGSRALCVHSDSYSFDDGVYSPLYSVSSGQRMVVQYYRLVTANAGRARNKTGMKMDNSVIMSGSHTHPDSTEVWQKVTWYVSIPETTSGDKYVETRHLGRGWFQSSEPMYIDDLAVYALRADEDGVDTTPPNAPTAFRASVTNSDSMTLTWTAPSGGLDGGAYMLVYGRSDPSAAPNVNGIYTTNNTIGSGSVLYIGTTTSFEVNGLDPNTRYYYRLYAFDKAFNYSTAAVTNIQTTVDGTLEQALDTFGMTWLSDCNGAAALPYYQTVTTHDGEDAVQSGSIPAGSTGRSWFYAWVEGPGTVYYWWRTSSHADHTLNLITNTTLGVPPAASISGTTSWALTNHTLQGPGSQFLMWSFRKDTTASAGDNCGWVDQVFYAQGIGTLADALDTNLTFTSSGDSIWVYQEQESSDGDDAARSLPIGHSQNASLDTTIQGPGLLEFDWKVSSEYGFDKLQLRDQPAGFSSAGTVFEISGEHDWERVVMYITPGSHDLSWRYIKDDSVSAGYDAGWVDQVKYTRHTLPIIEGFNAASLPDGWSTQIVSGTPSIDFVTNSIWPDATPHEGSRFLRVEWAQTGQIRLISPAFSTIGEKHVEAFYTWHQDDENAYGDDERMHLQWSTDLLSWTDVPDSEVERYDPADHGWFEQHVRLPSTVEERETVYVAFLFSQAGGNSMYLDDVVIRADPRIGEAVGNTNLVWEIEKHHWWFEQPTYYYEGSTAARSWPITHSQTSRLWTVVESVDDGTLSFHWRAGSESSWDWLEFYVGSERQGRHSGATDWLLTNMVLSTGEHTLEWRYLKDSSVSHYPDLGLLDNVEWDDDTIAPRVDVRFDGGTNLVPGDLAVIHIAPAPAADSVAILALADITPGTQVRLTDRGWTVTNEFGRVDGDEGTLLWTAPAAGLRAGDIFTVSLGGSPSASVGTIAAEAGTLTLSTNGDQLFLFQGEASAPRFIYGINAYTGLGWDPDQSAVNGAWRASTLPSTLLNGHTAVAITSNAYARYDSSLLAGTKDELLAAISSSNNWQWGGAVLAVPAGPFVVAPAITDAQLASGLMVTGTVWDPSGLYGTNQVGELRPKISLDNQDRNVLLGDAFQMVSPGLTNAGARSATAFSCEVTADSADLHVDEQYAIEGWVMEYEGLSPQPGSDMRDFVLQDDDTLPPSLSGFSLEGLSPPKSSLVPGDIAIIGFNARGNGDFSFVPLVNVAAGTMFTFSTVTNPTGIAYGIIEYTTPGDGLAAGEVVVVQNPHSGSPTVSGGRGSAVVSSGSFRLPLSGTASLVVRQGEANLYCMKQGNLLVTAYDGLGTGAYTVVDHPYLPADPNEGGVYSAGPRGGTRELLLEEIARMGNWQHQNTTAYDLTLWADAFSLSRQVGMTHPGPGDLAIVGFNANNNDDFSFVALVDIAPGVTFSFSTATNTTGAKFGTVDYTTPADGLAAGEVIMIDNPRTGTLGVLPAGRGSVTRATASGTFNLPLSTTASLLIHQNGTNIYCMKQGALAAAGYAGLSLGTHTVADHRTANPNEDGVYIGPRTGTREGLLEQLADIERNWVYRNAPGIELSPDRHMLPFDVRGDVRIDTFRITDADLAAGMRVAGWVLDAESGVQESVALSLRDEGGGLLLSRDFTTSPAAGGARDAAAEVEDTMLVAYDDRVLGVHTLRVSVADNDLDRPGDSLTSELLAQIDVVDDDAEPPEYRRFFINGRQVLGPVDRLLPGDILLTGYNSDDYDCFSFVATVDIEGGVVIDIMDNQDVDLYGGGGIVSYTTPPEGLNAGMMVVVTNAKFTTSNVGIYPPGRGTVTRERNYNVGQNGESIWVAQRVGGQTNYLYMVRRWGDVYVPAPLSLEEHTAVDMYTAGPNWLYDNAVYTGTTVGTRAEILAAVANTGNWLFVDNWWPGCYNPGPPSSGSNTHNPIPLVNYHADMQISGTRSDGHAVFTDAEIAGGIAVSGTVRDVVSGVYGVDGSHPPHIRVFNAEGAELPPDQALSAVRFGFGDGEAQLNYTMFGWATNQYGFDELTNYTLQVTTRDFDDDRPGDSLVATQMLTLVIIDDDEDPPSAGWIDIPEGEIYRELQPGDVVILGYSAPNANEQVVFMPMINLHGGTVIEFAEDDNLGSGRLIYTAPAAGLAAGTKVFLTNTYGATPAVAWGGGTVTKEGTFNIDHTSDNGILVTAYGRNIFYFRRDGVTTHEGLSVEAGTIVSVEALGYAILETEYRMALREDIVRTMQDSRNWTLAMTTTQYRDFTAWYFSYTNEHYVILNDYTRRQLTDNQISTGSWSVTGRLYDAYSGVDSTGAFGPEPSVTVKTGSGVPEATRERGFDTKPASGGSGLAAVAMPSMPPVDVTLGLYTGRIVVADFDQDRPNDHLVTSNYFTFFVVDNDTNAPIFQHANSYLSAEGVATSTVGPTVYYDIPLDSLATLSPASTLRFVLFAHDPISGLSHFGDGLPHNTGVSVQNWLTGEASGFCAASSSADATAPGASNVWVYSSISSNAVLAMWTAGENEISATVWDGDYDRVDDQSSSSASLGRLRVTPPRVRNRPGFSVPAIYLGDTNIAFELEARVIEPARDRSRVWISTNASLATHGRPGQWYTNGIAEKTNLSAQFTTTGNWLWAAQVDYGYYGADFWYRQNAPEWSASWAGAAPTTEFTPVNVQPLGAVATVEVSSNAANTVRLDWTPFTERTNVLIVHRMTNAPEAFTADRQGTHFNPGDTLDPGGEERVVFKGGATNWTHDLAADAMDMEFESHWYAVYTENHGYYSQAFVTNWMGAPIWTGKDEGPDSTRWDRQINWSIGQVPREENIATFYRTIDSGTNIHIASDTEHEGLLFVEDATSSLRLHGAGKIGLRSQGVRVRDGSTDHLIECPVELLEPQVWSNPSGQVLTFSGTVDGSGSLHKTGAGEMVLHAPGYTNATLVEQGRLWLGAISNRAAFTIQNQGAVNATGHVGKAVIGGRFSAWRGEFQGVLHCTNLQIMAGAELEVLMTAENRQQALRVNGDMSISGVVTVRLSAASGANFFEDTPLIYHAGQTNETDVSWVVECDETIPGELHPFFMVLHRETGSGMYYIQGATPMVNIENGLLDDSLTVELHVETVSNLVYDLIYMDRTRYEDTYTNRTDWHYLYSMRASNELTRFTNNISSLPLTQLRFYRASPMGSWSNAVGTRYVSEQIYVARRVPLFPGRNWIALPCVPPDPALERILGSGANLPPNTQVNTFTNCQGRLWPDRTFYVPLDVEGGGPWHGTNRIAEVMDPHAGTNLLSIKEGFLLSLAGTQNYHVGVVGKMRVETNELVVGGRGAATFISSLLPGAMHPDELNLLESGFKSSTHPQLADLLFLWDAATQRRKGDIIWHHPALGWRRGPNASLPLNNRIIGPSDGFIIRTGPLTDAWVWTNKFYYRRPTHNMNP